MRKHYLDNIRWAVVLLVVIYHVFYLFNGVGVLGGIGSFSEVQVQDGFLYAVYPWFMVLLFVVAGISARYALEQKTTKEFIRSRTVKLLVPATLGLLVFQWIVGLFNVYIGGGLALMADVPLPIRYLIYALSGTGPLWLAQTLWLFSLLLVLIRKSDRADRFYNLFARMHPGFLVLGGFLLWGGAQIGNMPVITTYRFGVYGVAFLLGYFVLSHEPMQEALGKAALPLLLIAVILGGIFVWEYFGTNYTEDACLRGFFTNIYAWTATLAVLGCGKAWFDKTSPFAAYMARSSFGVYVLHYLFTLAACYGLKTYTALPMAAIYLLSIVCAFAGTFACYELFRRIPFIRYTVLGIQKAK